MTLFSLIYQGIVSKTSPGKILKAQEFSELLNITDLLNKAHEDVEKLLNDTQQTCETNKQEASEEGYQEGLVRFNEQLIYLDQKVKQMEHEMHKIILPLALQAAKKIVGAQLTLDASTIVEIVMQVLKPVRQCHEIKIFVSKEDFASLDAEKEKLKSLFDHVRIFSIEERSDLTKGSCIIQTEAGIINATLENQWRALEAAFTNLTKS